ncbi:MAG: HDOD domain-containing protein, partial [bacterium]|nr:HDOD domain-containing protein [bacterium]
MDITLDFWNPGDISLPVRTLNIESALERVKELPTLPDVVFKVNELVNDKNTSSADLERVISRDQAIAAKVLKLVNSSFYGLPRRVDTLSRAIPLLGFSTVRNLVMTVSIFDLLTMGSFDVKQFWQHAFGTSIAARAIAIADNLPDAETHSLAGLLHDIGKVLMMQCFPKEYQAVLDMMEAKGCNFLQAEKKLYPTNHCLIGSAVADKWGFPVNLKAVIEHHHNPEPAGDLADFVAVTTSANILAHPDEEGFFVMKGFDTCEEACESFHPITMTSYRMVSGELEKQMQFF